MSEDEDLNDVKNEAKSIVRKTINIINKSSTTKQLFIGTASGWTTGYITMKIGKTAAFAVGGGIILLQIAQTQGYITIDWHKIRTTAFKTTKVVEEKLRDTATTQPTWVDQMNVFCKKNSCFIGGFLGGFFIGLAM